MVTSGSYKTVLMNVFHKTFLSNIIISDLATCPPGQTLEDGITSDFKAVED